MPASSALRLQRRPDCYDLARMSEGSIRKRTLLAAIVLIIAAALVLQWIFWPGVGRRSVEFDVVEGATGRQLAEQLKAKGIVRSTAPLRFWMRVRGAGSRIQIGRYRFHDDRSAFWIVDDLVNGRSMKARVPIPEGFASWQIAERLELMRVCGAGPFRKVVADRGLEGYLYPATYDLTPGLSAERIAARMKEEFDRQWTPELEARAKERGLTRHQVVTLASIIEREVRVRDELPLVSAVYNNRLARKMRLQADPTVQYALGYWARRLTYNDYRNTQSPYNTYTNDGLPPGPICSPGIDAVRAALWPAQSDALYMVAKEDGRHNFSNSYRDHTNKVNRRNRQNRKGG